MSHAMLYPWHAFYMQCGPLKPDSNHLCVHYRFMRKGDQERGLVNFARVVVLLETTSVFCAFDNSTLMVWRGSARCGKSFPLHNVPIALKSALKSRNPFLQDTSWFWALKYSAPAVMIQHQLRVRSSMEHARENLSREVWAGLGARYSSVSENCTCTWPSHQNRMLPMTMPQP